MNNQRGTNIAASIRDRLLVLARERNDDFQLLLTRYGLERLLYRLSKSPYKDRFILKGAMLFLLWKDEPHRPTRDVDLLGFGDNSTVELQAIFQDLCNFSVEDDGLILIANSVQVEDIRSEAEYGGMRVKFSGELAGARIPIQVDIGFGDVVTPGAEEIVFPTLLDNAAPCLKAYTRETVVAEKYQALVHLGLANSRMKDYFDLWSIANGFGFHGETLSDAIYNTFSRRGTALPKHTPPGLSSEFHKDVQKINQWNSFLRKTRLVKSPPTLTVVCSFLETFLLPPTEAMVRERKFKGKWQPGGPWF